MLRFHVELAIADVNCCVGSRLTSEDQAGESVFMQKCVFPSMYHFHGSVYVCLSVCVGN